MFSEKNGGFFRFGDFEVDVSKRALTRGNDRLTLNPKAFDLLVALLERHGAVLSKAELLERVWPDQFVEEGNLTVHVAAIRKALGDKKDGARFIATVPGLGYQFVGEVLDGDSQLVVEEHSFARITIESSEEDTNVIDISSHGSASRNLPIIETGRRSWSKPKFLILAGILVATFVVGGLYAYRTGILPGGTFGLAKGTTQRSSRQLTTTGNVGAAWLSRDGRYFVYQTFQNGIYAMWYASTSGGPPVQIKTPDDSNYGGLALTAAGDSIIYVYHGNLFKMPVLGGPPQMLLDHVTAGFCLSKDQERVFYTVGDPDRKLSLLMTAELATGERRELATLPIERGFGNYPGISPDGKTVAIGIGNSDGSNQASLAAVDVASVRLDVLNSEHWNSISETAWLPDGTAILFHTVGPNSDYHIWMMDLSTRAIHCITDDLSRYGRASLSISDDGTKLLAVRGEISSSLWVGDASQMHGLRQATSRTVGKLDGSAGMAWTPDGKIVYSSFFDNSYSIWIIDPAGGEPKQVTPSGSIDRFPSTTSDGKTIVFQSNRGGGDDIWSVNVDGSNLQRLTSGGPNSAPDVSPDGQWIIFEKDDEAHSIWKVGINGEGPVQLVTSGASQPKIAPDGKHFICLQTRPERGSRRLISVFPIDGGEPLFTFDYPASAAFANGFHWTPDGSAIVYRDFGSGMWMQPLIGGPPQKIPNLPDQRIYFLDWSRDGRQIALSYGDEYRDVVLISNFH